MTEGIIDNIFDQYIHSDKCPCLLCKSLRKMRRELIKEIKQDVESPFCPICLYREQIGLQNNHHENLLHQACINRYKKKLIGDTRE